MDFKAFISSFHPHNLDKPITFSSWGEMPFSFLPAPRLPLHFLVSNQWVLAEPGLTGEPAGSFSSLYALGLIQANGVSQFIMHLPPLTSREEAPVYTRFGAGGITATETAKRSCQYPMKEIRDINICKKMCPDPRRWLQGIPRMQEN